MTNVAFFFEGTKIKFYRLSALDLDQVMRSKEKSILSRLTKNSKQILTHSLELFLAI